MSDKSGYLRGKCKSCDAFIKQAHPDVVFALSEISAGRMRMAPHQCDRERMGVVDVIGCTFDEERTPE